MGGREKEADEFAEDRLGELLGRVIDYCGRLAGDATLPEEVRERARRALAATIEAAEALRAIRGP